jgi:translation elongation factor EF-Ts
MTKAKQALVATNNDYDGALAWLEKDAEASGIAKAKKLKDRTAAEGLVAVALNDTSDCGVMIEVPNALRSQQPEVQSPFLDELRN